MYSILPNITHNFAEDNTCDIIASGGIKELLRITRESPREDTRNLAKKALDSNPAFLREIQ
jgi:kinesin family protein 5